MEKAKRVFGLLLVAAVLATMLSGFEFTALAVEFNAEQLIEAEAGVLGSVKTISDVYSSGGKYIIAHEVGRLDDPLALIQLDASYTFNIPLEGDYLVWMKVKIPNGSDGSFYCKWDSNSYSTVSLQGENGRYTWINTGKTQLSAGVHTFNWCHRDADVWLDSLFVTTNTAYVETYENFV